MTPMYLIQIPSASTARNPWQPHHPWRCASAAFTLTSMRFFETVSAPTARKSLLYTHPLRHASAILTLNLLHCNGTLATPAACAALPHHCLWRCLTAPQTHVYCDVSILGPVAILIGKHMMPHGSELSSVMCRTLLCMGHCCCMRTLRWSLL